MKAIILIISSILLADIGQLFLKNGMLKVGEFRLGINLIHFFLKAFTNWSVLLGFTSYFLGSMIWLIVLSKYNLSFAYPMLSLGYIFVCLASTILFKEKLILSQWIGILTICLGVFLINKR